MDYQDPNVRIFANRTVNIKEYYINFPPEGSVVIQKQKNATFVKYGWLDISGYTLDDPRLNNIAVRANQNMGDRHHEIAHSYDVEGWDSGQFPPIVSTTTSLPKDGRNRIRAALLRKETAIPCAYYSYEDEDTAKSEITNGLLANKHKSQRSAEFYDFVNGGVEIIQRGEMPNTIASIEKWLYNDVDIEHFYSNEGGTITKIAKAISERAERLKDGHLVILRERDDWLEWLKTSIDKHSVYYRNQYNIHGIDDIHVFIESGGSRDEQVWMRHILPRASQGKVTNIALWTKEIFPEDAAKKHKDFDESLTRFHRQTFGMVNKEIDGITLNAPLVSDMWNIVGVIPQILNDYQQGLLENHKLAGFVDFPLKIDKVLKIA